MMLAMVLTLLLAPPDPAFPAYTGTGSDILRFCERVPIEGRDNRDGHWNTEGMACLFYVTGYVGAIQSRDKMMSVTGTQLRSPYGELVCLPEGAENGQHLQVFIKYLRDHPEKLQLPSSLLALFAFMDAYPCPHPPSVAAPAKP